MSHGGVPTGSYLRAHHLTRPIRQTADRFPWLAWRVRAILGLLWWTMTFQLVSRLGLRQLGLSDVRLIGSSNLFDREWYLRENPNIRRAGVHPALHYLLLGAAEGRDPSPLFDSDWYLSQNPDLPAGRRQSTCPLLATCANRPGHCPILRSPAVGLT